MKSLQDFKTKAEEIQNWLKQEYLSVSTGRATPAFLDKVKVDNFGVLSPLSHVSAISIEDARTLRVTPYNQEQLKDIEKALNDADLGVTVSADSSGVRVIFPELTTERREMLRKLIKDKLEEAKISVRRARDELWSSIQEAHKNGEITEDEKFSQKDVLEEEVKKAYEMLEKLYNSKLEEINN